MDVPSAGLRQPGVRLRNKSNDIVRANVVLPAGAELETDDYVAGQLLGQSTALEIVATSGGDGDVAGSEAGTPPAASDPASIEEAGGSAARRRSGRRS
jgi:hypothetical protein